MTSMAIALSGEAIAAGEAYLRDTPVLQPHSGTQPDLFLRWNRIPLSADALDIVVHLHGFSQQGYDMALAEKVARSGLDLARRSRPTLAMVPRGNWIRHYYYDFPALLSGGIDRLVEHGVRRFREAVAAASPGAPVPAAIGRLILTAHSGGGMPAIDIIAGARRVPDEFYVFDGLYGRDPATGDPLRGVEVIDQWLGDRLRGEPQRQGAFRVVYIEQQTGAFSRAAAELIARRLASLDPPLAASFVRRYRVEIAGVQHSQIAARCTPDLLAASDAQFAWY